MEQPGRLRHQRHHRRPHLRRPERHRPGVRPGRRPPRPRQQGERHGVTAFEPLGDLQVTSDIAIAEDALFGGGFIAARGADSGVWMLNLFTIPYVWKPLGGTATSDPAISFQGNVTSLYVRGTDDALYVNKAASPDAPYRGYERIDGAVAGNPAAFGPGVSALGPGLLLARLMRRIAGPERGPLSHAPAAAQVRRVHPGPGPGRRLSTFHEVRLMVARVCLRRERPSRPRSGTMRGTAR